MGGVYRIQTFFGFLYFLYLQGPLAAALHCFAAAARPECRTSFKFAATLSPPGSGVLQRVGIWTKQQRKDFFVSHADMHVLSLN